MQFHYNAKVENVDFAIGGGSRPRSASAPASGRTRSRGSRPTSGVVSSATRVSSPTKKLAARIDLDHEADDTTRSIDLGENDLVFITNGGCVENSSMGSQNSSRPRGAPET